MKYVMTALLAVVLAAPRLVFGQQENPAPSMSLHVAALLGDVETTRQHIRAGSDLNEKDDYGSTPLIVAATFGKTEVATALMNAGANLGITNNDGGTALHAAAFLCRTEIVKALLDKGANRYLRDIAGNTALDAVAVPFDDVKGIYDDFGQALGPLGLLLDYEQIRAARPRIAEMLRPPAEELEAVNFTPLSGDGWTVSTLAEQGLDPKLVSELYLNAAQLETLYGLLIIKNGHLVAERYFNESAAEKKSLVQSVSKSYISALVGIALDHGCLSSLDQKMMEFFPEFADQLTDPRKKQITIRDMLQMRAGFPWEESDPVLWDSLMASNHLPLLLSYPLVSDPGAEFHYSNLTSYLLGVIVARSCDSDLWSYAQEFLLTPIGADPGEWYVDQYGYYYSLFSFTARDMARFGLLFLNDGQYEGNQILPADWVRESLQTYSEDAWHLRVGRNFRDIGYGYQWWSARAGEHAFDLAWGHGGQLIVLVDEFDMVIVLTADPFFKQHDGESWWHEKANINLVSNFIGSLPVE